MLKDKKKLRKFVGTKQHSSIGRGNIGNIWTETIRGSFVHCGRVCSYLSEKEIIHDVNLGYLKEII